LRSRSPYTPPVSAHVTALMQVLRERDTHA
jgi:hypothetical protein